MDRFGKGLDDPKLSPSSESDAGSDGGDEEVSAAQDVLDAIKANDAQMLSMALSRHYEVCQAKHEEEGESEEY